MTTEQFTAERDYRLSMSIISTMLKNGLLTQKEYRKTCQHFSLCEKPPSASAHLCGANTIMTKKYKPRVN